MSAKYNSLEELRRKKALLKKEVSELEDLLTFDNTKESILADPEELFYTQNSHTYWSGILKQTLWK